MNKNVPKTGQNIAISVKFHETVKLIVGGGGWKNTNLRNKHVSMTNIKYIQWQFRYKRDQQCSYENTRHE